MKVFSKHKKILSFLLVCLISFLSLPLSAYAASIPTDVITFPDQNLFNALVKSGVDSNNDGYITKSEMASQTMLYYLNNSNITNLSGMEYATNLLCLYLPNNNITDLTPILGLTKLQQLDLSGNTTLNKTASFAKLIGLQTLYLNNDNITDISQFQFPNVPFNLCLNGDNISDVSSLAQYDKIAEIDLTNNAKLKDVSALANLKNLQFLNLANCNVTSINFDSRLANLQQLLLDHNSSLTDVTLTGLSSLNRIDLGMSENLKTLSLSGLTSLTNINIISQPNLQQLNFGSGNGLTDLTITGNNSLSNINTLSTLTKLNNLDIEGLSKLSDISSFGNVNQLATMKLIDCPLVTDISPLSKLTKLTHLELTGDSGIKDVSCIQNMNNLSYLTLLESGVSLPDQIALLRYSDIDLNVGVTYEIAQKLKGLLDGNFPSLTPQNPLSSYTLTSSDTSIATVQKNYDYPMSDYLDTVTGISPGTVTITLHFNGTTATKSFNVTVHAINPANPDQPLGTIPAQQPLFNPTTGTPNLFLQCGNLWQNTSQNPNAPQLLATNVKSFLFDSNYEGCYTFDDQMKNSYQLILDNNNMLWKNTWKNTRKISDNVVKYDGHYALTSNGTLIDLYTATAPQSDVKDFARISDCYNTNIGTIILKTDNTLWQRADVTSQKTTNAFVKIADNVSKIDKNTYLTNSGSFYYIMYQYKYLNSYPPTSCSITTPQKIADNVAQYNGINYITTNNEYWIYNVYNNSYGNISITSPSKQADNVANFRDGYLIKTDGSTYNINNIKVLDTTIKAAHGNSYADSSNNVWLFDSITSAGVKNLRKVGTDFGSYSNNGSYADNGYFDSKGNYVSFPSTNSSNSTLYISGTPILTNIVNVRMPFVTRTDGSIWRINTVQSQYGTVYVPTLYLSNIAPNTNKTALLTELSQANYYLSDTNKNITYSKASLANLDTA
ncbi:MAG: hypothetical protein Q8876_07965, partial [Bacillota bacterium]|nr:hypothetical protein [Bacillota bacterium]